MVNNKVLGALLVEITEKEILRIHKKILLHGKDCEKDLCNSVLDEGCIPAICYGASEITDTIEKAAYFLQKLSTRHPFYEGNKRTAFTIADIILRKEIKCMITENPQKNYDFVKKVINEELSTDEIVKWLKCHITHLKV